MRDDVLSSAKAVSDDDSTAHVYAAAPSDFRAGSPAVKPCGTSKSRTADGDSTARARTTHSSRVGHKEIFPNRRLGAHPRDRPRRPALPQPDRLLAAHRAVADSGCSADGGTPGHGPSAARLGWHANAASGRLHPDTPRRNTAPGHTRAGRTARSLSTGSAAAVAPDRSLAPEKIVDHDEVDPRERQLPIGQVPERASIPLRDAFVSAALSFGIPLFQANHLPAWPPLPCRSAATDHRRSPALLVGEVVQSLAAANKSPLHVS